MDRPWFQMGSRDWLDDMELRRCSPAARGVLADLMCVAHEGYPYGHLADQISALSEDFLAHRLVISKRVLVKLLSELLQSRRLKTNESGVLFVPRMVRDEEIRIKRASGGNKSIGHPNTPPPKAPKPPKIEVSEGYPEGYPSFAEKETVRARPRSDSDSCIPSGVLFSSENARAEKSNGAPRDEPWDRYIATFLIGGRKLNEDDLVQATRQWVSLSEEDQAAALADIAITVQTASSADFVPFPVNHLKKKPWTRKGPGRLIQTKGANQLEAERLFMEDK